MSRLLKTISSICIIFAIMLASIYPFTVIGAGGQKIPHIIGFNGSAIAANYYTGGVMANGSGSATEADVQFYVTKAGTFSGLSANITAANATGSTTLTFRKNGANGNNTITFASGVTGVVSDTTHSDSVSVGDLINFQLSYSAGTATFSSWTILFEADDGSTNQFVMSAGAPAGFTNNNTTRYTYPVGGLVTSITTEANVQNMINHNAVASNFATYISANARTTNTTFRTRKNSANGSQSVVFGSGVTGLRRDSTNTDTITAGDLFTLSFSTLGSGGNIDIRNIQYTLTSDNTREITIMGGSVFTRSSTASSIFGRVNGALGSASDGESLQRIYMGVAGEVSLFGIYVSANASNRDMNIYLRDTGADATNMVTNTQATTGWLQDTTHSDTITATDLINFRSAVASGGAGSGSVTYNATTFLFTLPDLGDFIPLIIWF